MPWLQGNTTGGTINPVTRRNCIVESMVVEASNNGASVYATFMPG